MLLRDVVRARTWTATLDRWCAARPDLVPYRGTCLVHRAQMSTLGGNWAGALDEAAAAARLLQGPAAGQAAYQLGELHRLMGRETAAEDAYRRANALGVQPEPGLSRLRTAQGRPDVAVRTLTRLCAEPRPPEDRAELLAARVEGELAAGDVDAALGTTAELRGIADSVAAPLITGLADQVEGEALLAAGRPDAALDVLRRAQQRWTELDLPHACAQTRVLAGGCLRALGDQEAAYLEFEAARECFERLGAAPDLAHADRLTAAGRPADAARPGPLTGREVEVVRLVAGGHTNRAIAGQLCLSEKTVARHLANIYAKLDVPSRAAATAYAYDHGLV
jgi:DNA-binding CsgD family transcriptional regulator